MQKEKYPETAMQQWFRRYSEREVLQQSFQLAKRSSILISMNSTKGKQWLFYHSHPRDHHRLAVAGCCEPLHRSWLYKYFYQKTPDVSKGHGHGVPLFSTISKFLCSKPVWKTLACYVPWDFLWQCPPFHSLHVSAFQAQCSNHSTTGLYLDSRY